MDKTSDPMRRKVNIYCTTLSMACALTLLVSCTFAPGPPIPLGLGPELDQIAPPLFLLVVGVLAWRFGPALLRQFKKRAATQSNEQPAQSAARQRYAQGEITRDEFLRISEDLNRRA
jgi:uncharacterized membrane protein